MSSTQDSVIAVSAVRGIDQLFAEVIQMLGVPRGVNVSMLRGRFDTYIAARWPALVQPQSWNNPAEANSVMAEHLRTDTSIEAEAFRRTVYMTMQNLTQRMTNYENIIGVMYEALTEMSAFMQAQERAPRTDRPTNHTQLSEYGSGTASAIGDATIQAGIFPNNIMHQPRMPNPQVPNIVLPLSVVETDENGHASLNVYERLPTNEETDRLLEALYFILHPGETELPDSDSDSEEDDEVEIEVEVLEEEAPAA